MREAELRVLSETISGKKIRVPSKYGLKGKKTSKLCRVSKKNLRIRIDREQKWSKKESKQVSTSSKKQKKDFVSWGKETIRKKWKWSIWHTIKKKQKVLLTKENNKKIIT